MGLGNPGWSLDLVLFLARPAAHTKPSDLSPKEAFEAMGLHDYMEPWRLQADPASHGGLQPQCLSNASRNTERHRHLPLVASRMRAGSWHSYPCGWDPRCGPGAGIPIPRACLCHVLFGFFGAAGKATRVALEGVLAGLGCAGISLDALDEPGTGCEDKLGGRTCQSMPEHARTLCGGRDGCGNATRASFGTGVLPKRPRQTLGGSHPQP